MTAVPKTICVIAFLAAALMTGCKRSSTGGIDILAKDETADAGVIVADANEDLKKIKVLYDQNLDMREVLLVFFVSVDCGHLFLYTQV